MPAPFFVGRSETPLALWFFDIPIPAGGNPMDVGEPASASAVDAPLWLPRKSRASKRLRVDKYASLGSASACSTRAPWRIRKCLDPGLCPLRECHRGC